MVFPSTASIVQRKLGVHGCAAFDVQAVCSGFIYALSVADAMIKAGSANRALVIGSEVFSRLLDFDDRTTCVLFGDGAGAVVLEASDTPGVVATKLHADGRHLDILCTPGTVNGGKIFGDPLLKMDGPAVFKLAVGVLGDVANEVLELAGRTDFRRRLARAAPGEHPYHAEHGPQAEAARGTRGRDGGRTRQHVGRLDPAGARRRDPLAARSSAGSACCSKASAAASPGVRRWSTTEHPETGGPAFARVVIDREQQDFRSHDRIRIRLPRPGLAERRHARRLGRPPGRSSPRCRKPPPRSARTSAA